MYILRGLGNVRITTPSGKSSGVDIASGRRFIFTIDVLADVSIEIYNVVGRLVRKMNLGELKAGTHYVTWDGRTDENYRAPVGLYFATIRAGEALITEKIPYGPGYTVIEDIVRQEGHPLIDAFYELGLSHPQFTKGVKTETLEKCATQMIREGKSWQRALDACADAYIERMRKEEEEPKDETLETETPFWIWMAIGYGALKIVGGFL